jgi:hypothetical protein
MLGLAFLKMEIELGWRGRDGQHCSAALIGDAVWFKRAAGIDAICRQTEEAIERLRKGETQ